MKNFDWDKEKNEQLKSEREICFEDIASAVRDKKVLKIINHPNQKRYPSQKIMIININNYAYLVPYVEEEDKYFLKTIFPSRKATKKYIIKKK